MRAVRIGGCAVRGFSVFEWERFAGMEGTRVSVSKTGSASSRTSADTEMTSRNMAATRLDRRRTVEPMRRQVCGLRQRFRRALGTGRADGKRKLLPRPRAHIQIHTRMQTEPYGQKPSGPNPIVHSDGCLFHVKQCLFLPRFHVKQSSFSVRQAAARPIPSLRCHSDVPTQSCAPTQLCCQRRISQLQGQPILHVRRFFVAGSSE